MNNRRDWSPVRRRGFGMKETEEKWGKGIELLVGAIMADAKIDLQREPLPDRR